MTTRGKKFSPFNPLATPRFAGISTFNRLPYCPQPKKGDINVAILGIPFDGGSTFRPGARFGPQAVRNASALTRNYHTELDIDVYDKLSVADCGDVETNPLNLEVTMKSIERRILEIHETGAKVISVGGDHSTVLPDLRAIREKFGEFTFIQFDAHTDTADQAWGEKYHHGTPIRRAIEEKLLNGPSVFQIGIRGPLTSKEQDSYISEQGINVLHMGDFHDLGKREVFFTKIRRKVSAGPCYVSFDVDCVDPAFAPGTGTPVVGGLTSFEALRSLRALAGLRIVGSDVVEISPPYDTAELTALLGASIVFEILALMAIK